MATVYDFTVKDRKGNEVSLSEYRGKVLLIVNTAAQSPIPNAQSPLIYILLSLELIIIIFLFKYLLNNHNKNEPRDHYGRDYRRT